MFGPNRDQNTPLVWSVVASHWVKGSVFFSNVLVQQFRIRLAQSDGLCTWRICSTPRASDQKAGVRWRNANYLDAE